jgi:hypothetical protein
MGDGGRDWNVAEGKGKREEENTGTWFFVHLLLLPAPASYLRFFESARCANGGQFCFYLSF